MLYTYYICVISGPEVDQRWRKGGGMVEEWWRKDGENKNNKSM